MATVDLYDPDSYVAAPPHELLAELRRTDPVHFQEMAGEPGYWMVLKHADLVHVAREPNLFSASEGGVMLENLEQAQLEMMRNMLLAMDPPRHVDYRRPIAPRFKARVIANMEGQIRAICREIMAEAAAQKDVEFVHDVTSALPSRVIGQLMGLPTDDLAFIHRLAEMNTSGQDSDYQSDVSQGTIDMAMYAIQFAAVRREEEPREDLTTLLLETDFNGSYMTDIDFGSFFVQLVTAGNDTTKTMLSSGLRALLDHPDQLAALRADPSLIPSAVEEILRYENPLHYFRRTATADTELRGTKIAAGDKVVMFYTSANRDEDVFADSQRFDIRRSPNPHLSFGIAEHFCLGVHLARLEGRVFFEELLATFPTIELTGEPVRVRSNLNNALKSMQVRLTR
jgi:cytochrome P450